MQPSFPIPPAWRWRLAIGGFVALGFGLWLITFVYHRVAKANFEAHVAELAAKGESIEVDDLRPPPIGNPEDDVGAAPVFAEFLERCRKDPEGEGEDPVFGAFNFRKIPGFSADQIEERKPPLVKYLTSSSFIEGFDTSDEVAAARAILDHGEAHEQTLAGIREALARSRADFEAPYGDFKASYPGLNAFHNTGKYLHRQGQAALLLGRNDLARSNAVAILRFARHVGSHVTLIHGLVGISNHDNAIHLIREGFDSGAWSKEDLSALAVELEARWLEEAFLGALRMERAGAMIFWKQMPEDHASWEYQDDRWIRHFLLMPDLREGWIFDGSEFYSRMLQEKVLEDEHGNILTTRIVPPLRALPEIAPAGSDPRDQIRFYVETFRHGSACSSFATFASIRSRTLRSQVFQDHALIAISLALHQRKNGRLPATLDGLTLPSGAPLPLDPFTGVNYLYRPEGETDYLLYSPGPNGLDEGGLIRHRYEDGDWVWRLHLPDDFDYDAYRR